MKRTCSFCFLALEAAEGGRTSVCLGGPFEKSFGFRTWGRMDGRMGSERG
jgi:hypothetical protein